MLAMGLERNVLEQYDLVIAADFLERSAEVDGRILLIALGIFAPGASDATRRVEQTLPVGIVPGPADQCPDSVRDRARDIAGRRRFDQVAVFGVAVIIHPPSSRAISSATAAACSRISGTAMISQYRPLVSGPKAQSRFPARQSSLTSRPMPRWSGFTCRASSRLRSSGSFERAIECSGPVQLNP